MFGTYRALLALTVVFVHFSQIAELSGLYAVFGFFMLSGYLMTLIMQQSYGYSLRGIAGFGLNRFLRIYPLYWAACLLAVAVLVIIAGEFTWNRGNFYLPQTPRQWFQNLALVLEFRSSPQIILPAWTLTIELFFYALIGLGLSRTRSITALWLAGSVGYTAYMIGTGASEYSRFFTLGAASLPFALGAALYHWRDALASGWPSAAGGTSASWPILLFALYAANIGISHTLDVQGHLGLYLNLLICAALLVSLHARRRLSPISRPLDNWLGDLSYPIYLVHAPLAWLLLYICKLLGLPITGPSLLTFFIFLPPVVLVSWLVSSSIEAPIEKLRTRVKQAL